MNTKQRDARMFSVNPEAANNKNSLLSFFPSLSLSLDALTSFYFYSFFILWQGKFIKASLEGRRKRRTTKPIIYHKSEALLLSIAFPHQLQFLRHSSVSWNYGSEASRNIIIWISLQQIFCFLNEMKFHKNNGFWRENLKSWNGGERKKIYSLRVGDRVNNKLFE